MKYYIIAGEASGDLHAGNLIKFLRKKDPEATFRAWGGERMQNEGATIVKHYRDLAFMGFVEVLLNLRTILKNISFCKKDIEEFNPDAIIFIDYPGFNLRIAEWAKEKGYKTIYYISPQIWAWKQSRVHKIKKCIDDMYVILPFEKDFYGKFDYDVTFVGHPLLDAVEQYQEEKPKFETFCEENELPDKPIISLLPGSRKQEIKSVLPIMLKLKEQYPDYQFIIAGAPSQSPEFYEPFTRKKGVNVLYGKTYELLQQSRAALVTSGTATLETALFDVPQVVCYKGSSISYWIARSLIKVNYISLVNLIMDEEIVKELIQSDLNTKKLKSELDSILTGVGRAKMLDNYIKLRKKLGGTGASENVATQVLKTL